MDPIVAVYITQAMHGLLYGMLLFLVASGLTLIFGMMGILNLAHASFYMLAAYFCYSFVELSGSFWISLLIAPVIVGVMGMMTERLFLRKLERGAFGHTGQILLTLGMALVISEAVKFFWGTEPLPIEVPKILIGFFSLAGLKYSLYRLFIIVLSLVILGILALLLYKTRLGMIVRAAVEDADMVEAMGINTPLVFTSIFGIGTWLAGVAGVVIAPILTVFPGLADQIGMDAFVVVIVGGFGSLLGALIAALLFGQLNSFGIQFMPRLAPVLMFLVMALVLSFKPKGFFGERE